MTQHTPIQDALAELLSDSACLSVQELAHACHMQTTWVTERLSAGILQGEMQGGQWRCAGTSLLRARRLAHLETTFDADPELAALATDLIEEVTDLRQQLAALRSRLGLLP